MSIVDIAQLVTSGTLIILLFQLREQRKQTSSDAYFSAVQLMLDNWGEMNSVMSDDFPGAKGWESNEREKADHVCMVFHQVGLAVKAGLLTEEICEVYFYAIPGVWEKCYEPHIKKRRNERHADYFHGFEYLVKIADAKNHEAERKGGRIVGDT